MSNLVSYGTVTLTAGSGSSGLYTEMANVGTSNIEILGNDSFMYVGSNPQGSSETLVDLSIEELVVEGGGSVNPAVLVNNGGTYASGGGVRNGLVLVDSGGLAKGAGYYEDVLAQNGGLFSPGNSPGVTEVGQFDFGPSGVSNYVFYINDATGVAGPTPDSEGHVSGWGLTKSLGDFSWDADADHQVNVSLQTLTNPTTIGNDIHGAMDNFDPAQSYSWTMVQWAGSYSGPTDSADLNAATNFDTSGFANSFSGTFGWVLDPATKTLSLTYTPG